VARPIDDGESCRDTSTDTGNFRPGINVPGKALMSSVLDSALTGTAFVREFSCNDVAVSARNTWPLPIPSLLSMSSK